jgi:hypothetical protein
MKDELIPWEMLAPPPIINDPLLMPDGFRVI